MWKWQGYGCHSCCEAAAYLEAFKAHCMWNGIRCQDLVHLTECVHMLRGHPKRLLHTPIVQLHDDFLAFKSMEPCRQCQRWCLSW